MLFGDLNAHIGDQWVELNPISEEIFVSPNLYESRESLHNITNARGNKLVERMEHLGFYTLNCRINGDILG